MSVQVPLFGKTVPKASSTPASRIKEIVGDVFDVKKFVENFESVAEASGGVARVRELILDLAVRGKLTPPAPASACALLNKPGPKSSEKPDVTAPPFELPAAWAWHALSELGKTQTGSTPSTKEATFWGGDVPFVAPGDIEEPTIGLAAKSLSPVGAAEARMVPANSVLMVCIGGSLGKVGLVRQALCCNQQINAITPGPAVEGSFLAVALRSRYFKREVWARALQGTLPIINKSKWEQILVPLPPLDEQKRIVAKVDELMALLDDLEAKQKTKRETQAHLRSAALGALTSAEGPEDFATAWRRVAGNFGTFFEHADDVLVLRKVVLEAAMRGLLCPPAARAASSNDLIEKAQRQVERHDANRRGTRREDARPIEVGDHPLLPSHWRAVRWREIGAWQNGRAFPSGDYRDSGTKLLRPGNLHISGRLTWTEENTRYLPESYASSVPEFIIKGNELVMNLTAQSLKDEFLGRVCLTAEGECCLLNQRIARLWSFAVSPQFAIWFFRSAYFRRYVDGLNQGTLIQHMFTSQLDQAIIFVPPLEEQQKIVAKVEHLMKLCDDLEAKLRRAEDTASKLVQAVVAELVGA